MGASVQVPAGRGRSTRKATAFASVLETVRVWRRRSRERRALRLSLRRHLNERLLRDIGVDPVDVRWEAGKPFWRD